MAALHEALTNISPIEWSELPKDNPQTFVETILTASELICNSVPPPADGTPFADSKPSTSTSNTATSHKDMIPSAVRSLLPDEELVQLQSSWGKPLKFSSKENPLEVGVYKMAGKDRHGGWFARRSVHEGIGFSKFRNAMKREFEQSLQVEGGPGAGCIRGIGADKKLEHLDIEGVGEIEVWQLSAQFPGPTTPREFIAMVITSEATLSEKSTSKSAISTTTAPRRYIIVSRPVKHPDAPDRSGYIRGQYESVELIREIPLHQNKSQATSNLPAKEATVSQDHTQHAASSEYVPVSASDETSSDSRELNPVEWIMITRSDPGGGIPRFMVDRGTPSAMIADMHKFLDWAANSGAKEILPSTEGEAPTYQETAKTVDSAETVDNTETESTTKPANGGILRNITQTIEAGLDAYAPTMISSFVHDRLDSQANDDDDDVDSSDVSDTDSFASATERGAIPPGATSSESISMTSIQAPSEAGDKRKLNEHEKKLLDISKQREKLDQRLARKREEEDQRLKKAQDIEDSETSKAQERYDKEIRKQEEKHRKELEKLEARKEKEAKKIEQKRQKQLDRDGLQKVTRERDEFRSQVDLLKRENDVLRERIEHLESAASLEVEKA